MASRLKIEEEQEGDIVETTDIFFEKIGEAVPIRSQEDPQFDLQSPPSQPLAVSQHHRLLFLVHSSGFLVARTKDVIDLAKDIKEKRSSSTIEDLSFVDVPVGKVNLLALSTADESTLAVSVAADILFFNVDSILNKDIKPFSSSSLPQSSLVKDFKWRKKNDDSFVVLSKDRKLYRGTPTQPLKHVMDDVDAVEWSLKGAYVAVARDNSLNILSSKFNEKLCMTLSLRSEIGDSNDERTVKVDTIKWIRPDCIILGCFTLSQEGKEENYFVQVVKSNAGKITDATSGLVVLSFSDLFAGLVDDIVPRGTGPYLFLSYLEQCELAIAANRKNTDQHIVLFSWSLGETGEASLVDIQRDNWLPRIELQDNGDDNLIMGLCIDKVSLFGNVKVQLGVEEVKELSPYCVLMCLTLEGKLILFHIASATENAVPPDLTAVSDNEEDSPAVVAEEFDLPKFTCGQGEQKSEQVVSSLPVVDKCKMELVAYGSSEIPLKSETNLCQTNVNSAAHATVEAFHKDDIPRSVFLENSHSFEAIGQIKPPTTKLFLEASDQLKLHFGQLGENLGQSFLKTSPLEGPGNKVGDSSQMGTQKIAGFGSSTSILGKFPNDTSTQLNHDNMPKKFELVKDSVGKTGSNGFQSMQFQAWPNPASQSSGGKFMVSQESDARSSFPPLTHIQNNKSLASSVTLDAANLPSSNVGKPSLVKDTSGTSFTVNKFSGAPPDIGTRKSSIGAGKIESVPLIHGSQLAPQLNFAVEKSPNQMLHTPKDAYKSSTQSGMLKSEPHLPKQFSNIKEMAKELDTLLESIEETGGYRDACTVSLKSSVEVLEQGIAFLSEKCWRRKNMMDEQLGKTQHLLDKSVQVLARKIYIEGIVKQASDSQYWDLWNRQKLSPELELKQRHILKLNQDLTNQLIELERHFNNFELHKFGDNYEMDAGRRALQSKFGHSRHIQSLHTLYNTTNTQLAAAEQLSECLSQQMAVLSVESPVKKQNVKKELFETLGIAYDASFTSPDASKPSNASSMDKLVLSSGSSISRNQSRRKQSSALKSFDTDITRRRRESLDQSWTSFEPPKTTVKRMLLQESPSLKRSSFTDMHNSSPYAPGRSKSSLSKEWTATSATLYQSGNEGIQDAFRKQESETTLFTWANSSLVQTQSAGLKSSTGQTNNFSALASTSGSHPMVVQNHSWETSTTTIAKPNSGASHLERSIISCFNENEIHSTLQHRPSQDLSISQVASLAKKSTDIPNSDGQRTVLSNSTVGGEKQVSSTTKSTLFGSSSNHDLQFKPSAAASTSPNLSEKVSHFNVVMGKSQPRETLSESSSVSKQVSDIAPLTFSSSTSSLSSSLSTMPTTSLTSISPSVSVSTSTTIGSSSAPKFSLSTSFPMVPTKSSTTQFSESMTTATLDANKKAQFPSSSALVSISSVFSSPHSSPFSSSSFFIQPPQTSLPSPADLAPVSTVSEALNKDVDSTRVSPPLQSELPAIELSLKPQSAVSSAPINETPTIVSAGNQMSTIDISSPAPSLASNTQPVQLSTGTGDILLKAPLSASISTADGKSESLDVTVSQEDEMEEEAPETNQRTEFSLGSLSSFGIGSTPNPTAAQPNPFGAPFGIVSATTASSSFSATVPSGELFKPASFSFQSPQPSQSAQPSSFASTTPGQPPAHGAFGQPAQLGAGQQALGSVLGAFGQSRQFGTGLQGGGFASASGFGGGFSGSQSAGGFSNAATGGFVGISSNNGGFAALATGGGGFASMASGGGGGGFGGLGSGGGGFGGLGSGGGFTTAAPGIGGFGAAASGGAGGGFGGAASAGGGFAGAASGGGFGAFGSQQGSGGFSAFGGGGAQTGKPPELFTQMRK